jgi:hypothetical protein
MGGAKRLLCGALLLGALLAQAQTKNAPIPTQILAARKVFISNVGADPDVTETFNRLGQSGQPYNRFYAEMKTWGRYELMSSPADADLVFEIRFSAPLLDCEKVTTYAPQYRLSIVDIKTHFTLWTLSAPVEGAFRKATFEKNLSQGMATLMADLKQLSAQGSPDVAAVSP